MKKFILFAGALFLLFHVYAQQSPSVKANYAMAARFSPKKLDKMVFSTQVDPHWLKKSNRFWYTYETSNGKNWFIVDPVKGEKRQLFDKEKMASELSKIVRDPVDAQHLRIDSMRFVKDENWIQFEVASTEDSVLRDTTAKKGTAPKTEKKRFYFEYNINSGELVQLSDLKKPKRNPGWASVSPDGLTIIFVRNYNLYWMDRPNYEKALQNEDDSTIKETPLTKDGVEYFGYDYQQFGGGGGETNVDKEKNKKKRKPAPVFWSPDSKHFALLRTDVRAVKDLWVINSVAEPRPTLETYKYWMPGEKESAVIYVLLFDNVSKTSRELNIKQFKDQDVDIWRAPMKSNTRDDDYRPTVWLGTNDKFYFMRTSRDLKRIDLCTVDINSEDVKTIIPERLNTYVEVRRPGVVNGGNELIEWSERDGWAHFYLYDGNGKLKNQITQGSFHCEDIVGIDEKKRVLYFTASGREPNEDPYYMHMYRVNFDGSNMRLLDAREFEHVTAMDDDQSFFVDNYSRVNATPKAALFNAEGKKLMDLETADLGSLFAAGYK
ncbi:MAG: DPP IV N-terminal domain-containing protein, partial [Flavisolibacter sp.]